MQYFNLTVTPCPPGHVLLSTDEEDEYECRCDDNNDENIVSCLPEESSIVLMVCLCLCTVLIIWDNATSIFQLFVCIGGRTAGPDRHAQGMGIYGCVCMGMGATKF